MAEIKDIFNFLCSLAPLELQCSFDNSGFQIGRGDKAATKVLLSLDLTSQVLEEAARVGAELIITHHPLIFSPLKAVTDGNTDSGLLLSLAERKIALISMHTNLDIADGGVNDVLISALGASSEAALDEENCGRIGHLSESINMQEFLLHCKKVLNTRGLRYYNAGRPVHKIAVMGGSGGDCIERAVELGCDTYVTADIKYHQFLLAKELGLNLIDADHFCTENPVIPVLCTKLQSAFPEVCFIVSEIHGQVVDFI